MKSLQHHDDDGGDDEKRPIMKKTMMKSSSSSVVTSLAVPSSQQKTDEKDKTTTTKSSSTATTKAAAPTATMPIAHLRAMSSMIINIHPIIYCLLIVFTAVVVWPVQSSQAVLAASSSSLPTTSPVIVASSAAAANSAVKTSALSSESSSSSSSSNPTTTATTTTLPSRGKYIGSNFQPSDLYDAFRGIQNDYEQRAFSPNYQSKWKILTKQKGHSTKDIKKNYYDTSVEVAMLEDPNDPNCPYVRLSAIIPVPVKECWNFLELDNWDRTMPKMDPFYEGVELHGDYSFEVSSNQQQQHHHHWWQGRGQQHQANKKSNRRQHQKDGHHHQDDTSPKTHNHEMVRMRLARKRTKRILTFSKRDFVFLSVSEETRRLYDGSWISGTISVRTPKLKGLQRQNNYVRAYQDSIAFYKPIIASDNQEHTQLTIVCRIDLNDNSPSSIDDEDDENEETDDGDNGHMSSNEINNSSDDDTAKGGWIPMWLYVKTIGITGARSITNMRDVLIQQHAEKERQREQLSSEANQQQQQQQQQETQQFLEETKHTSESDGNGARNDIIHTHQTSSRSLFGSIRSKLAFSSKGKRNTR